MLQNLSADRFKLVVHRETRERPVCNLVGLRPDRKLGDRLKRATIDCAGIPSKQPGDRAATPPNLWSSVGVLATQEACRAMTQSPWARLKTKKDQADIGRLILVVALTHQIGTPTERSAT